MKISDYNAPSFQHGILRYTDNSGYIKYCHTGYNFNTETERNGIFRLYRGGSDFNLIFNYGIT